MAIEKISEALEAYRRAAKRGVWMCIATSGMTAADRTIAVSWRYQFIALEHAKKGDHEQASKYAGIIPDDRIRESTMAKIYQIKNRAGSIKKSKPADNRKPVVRPASGQGHSDRPNAKLTQASLLPQAPAYFRQ